MKKAVYSMMFALLVVIGLVFGNREGKKEAPREPSKPLSAAERNAIRAKWEATPDGLRYKKWMVSPEGKKVLASSAKLRTQVTHFTDIEAVITSLSLPPGSRLGFGVMARINNDDYIVKFDPEKSQLAQLHRLNVNDRIIIRSHSVLHAPKYSYPIVSGEYVERRGEVIFKRIPRKGC
jgi:hypothetical protein